MNPFPRLLFAAILAAVCLATSACVSPQKIGHDYAAFIAELPAANITDVATVTQTPLWSFNASASGVSTDPLTGVMTITNGKAGFAIPLWGTTKTFSVSGLSFKASAQQLAAAAALRAAAEASAANPK